MTPTSQQRSNTLDTSKAVAVFYFYRVEPKTMSDRELFSYREVYGWSL